MAVRKLGSLVDEAEIAVTGAVRYCLSAPTAQRAITMMINLSPTLTTPCLLEDPDLTLKSEIRRLTASPLAYLLRYSPLAVCV